VAGQAISLVGRQLTVVATPVQIFTLTGSTFAVGLLGLAQFPALLVGSFLGGTLADAVDRRRLLIIAQFLLAGTTAGLALNAALDRPAVWAVYMLTALNALFSGIDSPARSATIPRLVGPSLLPAALALNVLLFQTATAVGPAVAGAVIARFSLTAAYWIDTATFGVAVVALLLMAPIPVEGGGTPPGFRSILEGLRFLRSKQALQGAFLIDINAMVFGMPRALFPELGLTVLGGTETTVGLLYAAVGTGAMLAAVTSGWVGRIRRAGVATTIAVFGWGLAIAFFGFTTTLAPALVLLAVAGAADAVSAVFRSSILQLTTPDRLRGRLSAVQIAVVAGGPRLGDVEAGVVSAGFGPQVAAWSGGLASAFGAVVIARLLPGFRTWVRPTEMTID
jgi:MFS family permease